MPAVEAESGRLDPSQTRAWRTVKKGYTPFQEGDVIFAKITPCMENGKFALATGLVGGRAAGSTEFHVLRPPVGLNPKLLLVFLLRDSVRREARLRMKGAAGQLRVPPEFLAALQFPLPPEPEQRRIVAEIEKHFTRLEASVAALKRVQANLKRYRASVLKAACEGRLVPTEAELAHVESGPYEPADKLLARILRERRARWEADQLAKMHATGRPPKNDKWKARYHPPDPPDTPGLPSLPVGWTWASVDQVAEVGTGATPSRSNVTYWEGGSVPWVTSGALNQREVTAPAAFVTQKALDETNLSLYEEGTLLVAMYGEGKTRGKCSELRIAATTNQAIAALTLEGASSACREYLRAFLEKNYDDVRRRSSGGVQPNLNLDLIKAVALPLPPLSEQLRVVAEADRRLSVIDELEATVEANLKRAAGLRQAILKRAFEGKLVPQDPSDEPASVLLERIRADRAVKEAAGKPRLKRTSKRRKAIPSEVSLFP
jgi:type I restriction enzyme S subunit